MGHSGQNTSYLQLGQQLQGSFSNQFGSRLPSFWTKCKYCSSNSASSNGSSSNGAFSPDLHEQQHGEKDKEPECAVLQLRHKPSAVLFVYFPIWIQPSLCIFNWMLRCLFRLYVVHRALVSMTRPSNSSNEYGHPKNIPKSQCWEGVVQCLFSLYVVQRACLFDQPC